MHVDSILPSYHNTYNVTCTLCFFYVVAWHTMSAMLLYTEDVCVCACMHECVHVCMWCPLVVCGYAKLQLIEARTCLREERSCSTSDWLESK